MNNENRAHVSGHKITAVELAKDIHCSIAWSALLAYGDAALSDCPYQEVVDSVFKTHLIPASVRAQLRNDAELGDFLRKALDERADMLCSEARDDKDEEYRGLVRLAARVNEAAKAMKKKATNEEWYEACHRVLVGEAASATSVQHPWSLAKVAEPLPEEEEGHWRAQRVISAAEVKPIAAISCSIAEDLERTRILSTVEGVKESWSPSVQSTKPEFFSTVVYTPIHEWEQRPPSHADFHTLHRYSRLATTSLLRQLQAFGVHVPVFGVLISGSFVALQIDWATEVGRIVGIDSAFYSLDESGITMKEWDLCNPSDALQITIILDNLRRYTTTTFASSVVAAIDSVKTRIQAGESDFKRWKWDGKLPVKRDDESATTSNLKIEAEEDADEWTSADEEHVAAAEPELNVYSAVPVPGRMKLVALVAHNQLGDQRKSWKAARTCAEEHNAKVVSPPYTPANGDGTGTPVSQG